MLRLSHEQARVLLETLERVGNCPDDVVLVADSLREQIGNPNHTLDLVETIAKILASPKAKAALSGTLLEMMRAAVLLPTELAKFRALADRYQSCKGCGRELANGEIASLHNQDPYCLDCVAPSVMYCPRCKAFKELPTGVFRVTQKAIKECKVCAANAASESTPAAPMPLAAPVRTAHPIRETERLITTNPRMITLDGPWADTPIPAPTITADNPFGVVPTPTAATMRTEAVRQWRTRYIMPTPEAGHEV